MNLIDFYVKEIKEETYDKVYRLFNISEEELNKQKEECYPWYKFLSGNGVRQVSVCSDMGGDRLNH